MSAIVASRRAVIAGVAVGSVTTILQPTSWFERFDPEAWIERWYRAGHKILANPQGRPMLLQNLDEDEAHAARGACAQCRDGPRTAQH